MVEATATQFELIMHHVETHVIESFWINYKKNNKGTPSPTMQNFIQDTIKWTVGETFRKIMVEIFDENE